MIRKALSFDDVLLVPNKFSGNSRSEIDLSTNVAGISLKIPIIAANMPSVCEVDMAVAVGKLGGLGIIHRMNSDFEQAIMVAEAKKQLGTLPVGAAIGIGSDWKERAAGLIDYGVDIICVDVAHAHQEQLEHVVRSFWQHFGSFPLIIGNIATLHAAKNISVSCGHHIGNRAKSMAFKVGIGGGSVCTTRIKTGCGVPTFQSVLDVCGDEENNYNVIADGGIKSSGDIVKALAAGANTVMLGSLLAGTDEAPGRVIKGRDGAKYKIYRGNASYGTKRQNGDAPVNIEGEETLVSYKGSVEKVINKLLDGIRSGLSYCGALSITELHDKKPEFVEITSSGYRESLPHGLL